MSLKVRIGRIDQWVRVTVDRTLSPKARSELVADYARERLAKALDTNRKVLGSDTPYEQFVDGRRGAALESVNPNRGNIIFEFELVRDVLRWIMEALVERSPRGPAGGAGTYRDSHQLVADDRAIEWTVNLPAAEEYSFANQLPYSRRLEIGRTRSGRDFLISVPNRIYERTAKDARVRFGNVAKIGFTYRGYAGGGVIGGRAGNKAQLRYPTITVRPT